MASSKSYGIKSVSSVCDCSAGRSSAVGCNALTTFQVIDPVSGEKPDYLNVDVSALMIAVEADFDSYVYGIRDGSKDVGPFVRCWDACWDKA